MFPTDIQCGWVGADGAAPQHLPLVRRYPYTYLTHDLTASGWILTPTTGTPQNLSASGTVTNVAYIFFFFLNGYDQTHYCYPRILLCGNEENQFHFPKEEVKCLRSGSCSFIRGVLNVLKWEGQEIEWRFCVSELPRDTLRVTEVPRSGERDWVCINSHYYGCIRLKNKQCNNQNVWCDPKDSVFVFNLKP